MGLPSQLPSGAILPAGQLRSAKRGKPALVLRSYKTTRLGMQRDRWPGPAQGVSALLGFLAKLTWVVVAARCARSHRTPL
jgi:hypothetical protein